MGAEITLLLLVRILVLSFKRVVESGFTYLVRVSESSVREGKRRGVELAVVEKDNTEGLILGRGVVIMLVVVVEEEERGRREGVPERAGVDFFSTGLDFIGELRQTLL